MQSFAKLKEMYVAVTVLNYYLYSDFICLSIGNLELFM